LVPGARHVAGGKGLFAARRHASGKLAPLLLPTGGVPVLDVGSRVEHLANFHAAIAPRTEDQVAEMEIHVGIVEIVFAGGGVGVEFLRGGGAGVNGSHVTHDRQQKDRKQQVKGAYARCHERTP